MDCPIHLVNNVHEFLIAGLFVDVGNNYSVLEYTNVSFVYDDIDARDPMSNIEVATEVSSLLTFYDLL